MVANEPFSAITEQVFKLSLEEVQKAGEEKWFSLFCPSWGHVLCPEKPEGKM